MIQNIKQVFEQYKNNPTDETKNAVVLTALPAVDRIVNKFQNGKVIEKNDLFQEGVLGVYAAIDKSESSEDFENKVYSLIKSRVLKYSIKQDPLSTNQYSREKSSKINKFVENYLNKNLKEPSPEEISEGTGIQVKNLSQFQNSSCGIAEIEDLLPEERNFAQDIEREDTLKNLFRIIEDKLSLSEKNIISKKYGINSPQMTLEEIGLSLEPKICKQRVDQIHKSILSKLKKALKSDY